jgi:hypothetical protein
MENDESRLPGVNGRNRLFLSEEFSFSEASFFTEELFQAQAEVFKL